MHHRFGKTASRLVLGAVFALALLAPTTLVTHAQTTGIVIDTGELEEAIEAAEAGNLNRTRNELRSFDDAWENTWEGPARVISTDAARAIESAIRAAQMALAGDTPSADAYLPALRNVLDVVLAQQPVLNPTVAPPPPPDPVALGPWVIDTGELEEAIEAAEAGNLNRTRNELTRFEDEWENNAEGPARARSPEAARAIESAIRAAQMALAGDAPSVDVYLPALRAIADVILLNQPLLNPQLLPVPLMAPVAIDTRQLEEAIQGAELGNLNRTRNELNRFNDMWENLWETPARAISPDAARTIEAAIRGARTILAGDAPVNEEYLAALRAALEIVQQQQLVLNPVT